MAGNKRWEEKEVTELFNGIGSYGMRWFQDRTRPGYDWPNAPDVRSRAAIYAKMKRLYGPGGLSRGVFTLREAMNYSGYSRTQLLRGQKALKQKWKRTGPDGSYLITDEQLDEILEWLVHDYWCKKKRLYNCAWCATETKPPVGHGLCGNCYAQYKRACKRLDVSHDPKLLYIEVEAQYNSGQYELLGHAYVQTILQKLQRGVAITYDELKAITEGGVDETDSWNGF
jgi:hypothetical protein